MKTAIFQKRGADVGKFGLDICRYTLYYNYCGDEREVINMPRMGRPTDDRKDVMFRVRMSESDIERLQYCENVTGKSKSEIIRAAITAFYERTKSSAPATPDK